MVPTDPAAETTASASAADAGPNPPTPPPPPYESVVLDDPRSIEIAHSEISHSGKAVKTQTQKPKKPVTTTTRTGSDNDDDDKAEVEVASAVKIGEGMSAYAAYPVRFVTDSTDAPATYAQRRFSDFTKLRRGLQKSHPGCVVHPLPEKIVTTSPFSPEFLTQRRRGLGLFLSEIAAHPVLAKSEHLSAFLTPDEIFGDGSAGVVSTANGWAVSNTSVDTVDSASPSSAPGTPSMKPFQKSPSQQKLTDEAWYHRGAAGTALSAVDGWFKQVATATESFVHGATPDTVLMEEDQTYLEASEYLLMLEDRLRRAARASDEVVSCVNAGGLIIGNFGDNCVLLGDVEERGAKTLLGQTAGGLGQAFRQVGAAAISTRAAHEQKAEQLANEFRAPIRDALELCKAARETIDLRSESLLRVQTTRAQSLKKKTKLESALEKNPDSTVAANASADGDVDPTTPGARAGSWFATLASSTTSAFATKVETLDELRLDVTTANDAYEAAKVRYETIQRAMRVELPRVHARLGVILNRSFRAAQLRLKELAAAQAGAWEAVMPGCADVAALDPPPMPTPAEGVVEALARGLAGVMGAKTPAILGEKP